MGAAMKNVKVTGAQHKVLQILSRKDVSAIQRNPKVVAGAKHLLLACKKTIKKVEEIPQYASRKKRETAYRRIVALCRKAIDAVEP
jgi:tRNA threonylcarbamoyladenosine modification (KEOPS) complex Cgi121 subunit